MKRTIITAASLALLALVPIPAGARALGVEVWTDRGNDAVYEPGDRMQVKVRASDDVHLLVYEIDSEGYVRVLFPFRGGDAVVEGHRTYRVPSEDSDMDLVVENPVGEGYIVALASEDGFSEMPWYLRAYDPRGEANGYVGAPQDEEGITAEGRIVGDPFVAMERIRRRVLDQPDERGSFATDYTTYYVHQQVRYPRYVCYDCHRPNRYAFWDGFDPYYTSCSVFDFRVNWSWCWGPSYWFGRVPYFVYVYRPDCPPRYRNGSGVWYSSWDGWRRWNDLWGSGGLRRYKSPPPANYVPPAKYRVAERLGPGLPTPPGFIARDGLRGGGGRSVRPTPPLGRGGREDVTGREGAGVRDNDREGTRERPTERGGFTRPAPERSPAVREPRDEGGRGRDPGYRRPSGDDRPAPSYNPPPAREPASGPKGDNRPAPRDEPRGRVERPAPPPQEKSPPPPDKTPPPPPRGRGDGSGGHGKGGNR